MEKRRGHGASGSNEAPRSGSNSPSSPSSRSPIAERRTYSSSPRRSLSPSAYLASSTPQTQQDAWKQSVKRDAEKWTNSQHSTVTSSLPHSPLSSPPASPISVSPTGTPPRRNGKMDNLIGILQQTSQPSQQSLRPAPTFPVRSSMGSAAPSASSASSSFSSSSTATNGAGTFQSGSALAELQQRILNVGNPPGYTPLPRPANGESAQEYLQPQHPFPSPFQTATALLQRTQSNGAAKGNKGAYPGMMARPTLAAQPMDVLPSFNRPATFAARSSLPVDLESESSALNDSLIARTLQEEADLESAQSAMQIDESDLIVHHDDAMHIAGSPPRYVREFEHPSAQSRALPGTYVDLTSITPPRQQTPTTRAAPSTAAGLRQYFRTVGNAGRGTPPSTRPVPAVERSPVVIDDESRNMTDEQLARFLQEQEEAAARQRAPQPRATDRSRDPRRSFSNSSSGSGSANTPIDLENDEILALQLQRELDEEEDRNRRLQANAALHHLIHPSLFPRASRDISPPMLSQQRSDSLAAIRTLLQENPALLFGVLPLSRNGSEDRFSDGDDDVLDLDSPYHDEDVAYVGEGRARPRRQRTRGNAGIDVDNMSYEQLLELGERLGKVEQGLPKALLNQLPVRTYDPSKDGAEETCSICQENYHPGDKMRTLTCLHAFHVGCIDKWLSTQRKCPICLVEISL